MTAVQTLQAPKAKRKTVGIAPPSQIETEKPKTWQEWSDLDSRLFIENQRQDGVPEEDIITMAEVVAICKEVRAEIYAEEQALANNR
jgi:hypothetical protein